MSNGTGANWRALSGDDAQPQPVPGGWTQPWQDERGQWHYPYAAQQPVEQPPYEHAAQQIAEPQPQPQPQPPIVVQPEQLAPVDVPRHYAPRAAARDPRQRTMAAVITFVALLFGLWGVLGFTGSLSKTLASISSGNQKLKLQLTEANAGLASLDEKTAPLAQMATDSELMASSLGGIESDMGSMLTGVDGIAAGMTQMSAYLDTLDSELGQVNAINASMASDLGEINAGLGGQLGKVRTMRRDVQATGDVLGTLSPRLRATNARLAHVNGAVNTMGCRGVVNELDVKIHVGPIPNGTAKVRATIIPPGAWGVRADGVTPC